MMKDLIAKIERLQTQADQAWREACAFDAIPDYELFIVFTDRNPHAIEHNRLRVEIIKARNKLVEEFGQPYI